MFSGIGVTLIHDDGFIAAIVLMSVGVVLYPIDVYMRYVLV